MKKFDYKASQERIKAKLSGAIPETELDKKIAEYFGWDWSDNQKRLVKANIEPIVYDGKEMVTNGAIPKLPKELIRGMTYLHSDIVFVGSDGKVHLVEENLKPDYNEWNW